MLSSLSHPDTLLVLAAIAAVGAVVSFCLEHRRPEDPTLLAQAMFFIGFLLACLLAWLSAVA